MRVVLDANVLIAAVAGRGLCDALFELCIEEHELIVSRELLDEVHRKLIKKIKLPESLAHDFCGNLQSNARMATPVEVPENACRDPKDLYLLGLCVSSNADFLVTGDKDLLDAGWRGSTIIVTPRQFWERCGQR
jgi:putative PIN family toxin of toxin-antitoxin system